MTFKVACWPLMDQLREETTMKTKQFTKADLKTGHRVTTRNGRFGL